MQKLNAVAFMQRRNAVASKLLHNGRGWETSPLPLMRNQTFLMSDPLHFDAMCKMGCIVQRQTAVSDWLSLRGAIEQCGARVIVKRASTKEVANDLLFREIFMRDYGLSLGQAFILPARQTATAKLANDANYTENIDFTGHMAGLNNSFVCRTSSFFEGGNYLYDAGRGIVIAGSAAYDTSETRSAIEVAISPYANDVVWIDIKSDQFYHLDTFMGVLPGGILVACRGELNQSEMAQLEAIYGEDIIWLTDMEADRMSANFICAGANVIMPFSTDRLSQILRRYLFEPITPETCGLQPGSWNFGRGSVRCVTQELDKF